MTFVFDPADEVHARAIARLESEQIAWLVTRGRDGYPHAVPVWFLWHDGAVLVFSEPKAAKAANIRADDRVALHLEAGEDGEQLTVLRGVAQLSDDASLSWVPEIGEAYSSKYAEGLRGLSLTTETMFERYSTAMRVVPHKLIAW
jgi:PPOX class probable F420-dependent enzyme